MANETKTFRLKYRVSKIFAAVMQAILALFMLTFTITRFNAYLRGEVSDWKSSWGVTAFFFVVFVFFLVDSLKDAFLQITLSKDGVWYSQLGSKKFVPWKQIERVGITRTYITGKKQFGFILKPKSDDEKRTLFGNKQNNEIIPLSIFVDHWLGSELQNEIKRLYPRLPMQ
jgi:hypothetical protein